MKKALIKALIVLVPTYIVAYLTNKMVYVCKLVNGYCVGCRRTGKEITKWIYYTHKEREEIMAELHERMYLI